MSGEFVYSLEKIADDCWVIVDKDVRFFLFVGSEKALLVDSGHGSGDLARVVAGVTGLPVMLVNTHADHDHVGGNLQFDNAWMHPSDFARYRLEIAGMGEAGGQVVCFAHKAHHLSPCFASPLWEGDVIDIGGRCFEVIHIPGHTPGSIALLDDGNRVLLGGDSVIDDRIAMNGEWRDLGAYIASVEKLAAFCDRFDTVYTPHGGFPVSSDIVGGLVLGAKRCRDGDVVGVDTDFIKDTKIYDVGVAKFVY